jgi:hypothetical protein
MFDLKKYFKDTWDKLDNHRKEFVSQKLAENIECGQKKGYFRKDFDTKLVVAIYVYLVDLLLNPDAFPEGFDQVTVHKEITRYHLRSVCTAKGLEVMDARLKEINRK